MVNTLCIFNQKVSYFFVALLIPGYRVWKSDIHLRTLHDKQEYSVDKDVAESLAISSANWSLIGVIWGSRKVLASYMFDYKVGK